MRFGPGPGCALVPDRGIIPPQTQTSFTPEPRCDSVLDPDRPFCRRKQNIEPYSKPMSIEQHINELFSAATSGNIIHPSLCLGKRTLQLYSSTGNHRVNKSPGVPPKNFGKQILPTLHTIQFWILPHAQFRQKFLTLLLQQTRATTPFQRAGLIPQFAKCPNSHKHNFASV